MRLSASLTLVLVLGLAAPTGALSQMENNLLAGINGLFTAPADAFAGTIEPPEEFRELPGGVVVAPVLGFCTGVLMTVYRAGMGVLDIALFPVLTTTLSPEPRFPMFEGSVEYE